MTEAESRIIAIRDTYIGRTLENWKGNEQIFVIELVRALDEIAFAFNLAPNRNELIEKDKARQLMLQGATMRFARFSKS